MTSSSRAMSFRHSSAAATSTTSITSMADFPRLRRRKRPRSWDSIANGPTSKPSFSGSTVRLAASSTKTASMRFASIALAEARPR